MPERKRVLTGIRPTGPLHLGHHAGALSTWLELQGDYDCCFLIADYQVSDHSDDLPRVRNAVWDVALDWLAAGLDLDGASFVFESGVPEHAELTTWLAWLLPVGMLERNPTLLHTSRREQRRIEGSATRVLNDLLEPMRQRRARYEGNMARVREALEHGTGRARAIARETMERVHDALDLDYLRKNR